MQILVQRVTLTDKSTIGELSLDGGDLLCYTLELPKPQCIPAGSYKVIIAPSAKFGRLMPRLLSVPGWPNDDIEIHYGNYPSDTEGCILVGLTQPEPDFIGESRMAFDELFPKLEAPASAGDLYISVVG